MLAAVLAFRGHLQEARAVLPTSPMVHARSSNPLLDLALLGAVSPDSVRNRVRALVARGSLWPPSGSRYAVPWWYADRDTAALKRFELQAGAAARRYPSPVAKAYLRNLAEVARAYLVLARGDSTEGFRMLAALPDSLCALSDCFFEKFTLAELAVARGQVREAAAIYDRWLRARDWSPSACSGGWTGRASPSDWGIALGPLVCINTWSMHGAAQTPNSSLTWRQRRTGSSG
jgi:hypothetical protein